jgi:hypothetical protein
MKKNKIKRIPTIVIVKVLPEKYYHIVHQELPLEPIPLGSKADDQGKRESK